MGSHEEIVRSNWKLLTAIIVAIVGGNFGTLLNKTTSDMRYDAWTGTQDSREMEKLRDEVVERFRRNETFIEDARDDAHVSLKNDAICQRNVEDLYNIVDDIIKDLNSLKYTVRNK